jgi:hypothetical protein
MPDYTSLALNYASLNGLTSDLYKFYSLRRDSSQTNTTINSRDWLEYQFQLAKDSEISALPSDNWDWLISCSDPSYEILDNLNALG